MEKLTSEQIRDLWKSFWESPEQNHKEVKPASVVPDSADKTVLFTTAWMQQLVPYLVGKPHPLGKRVYNIQKCVRTWDIEDVWDERHLTFFEMMWNWSLWDYFKKEAINWSYNFLTKYLKIEHDRIWATVFQWEGNIPVDEESISYWKWHGIIDAHIRRLSSKDNFWWPAWEVGPCGPCSEMYVDRWPDWGPEDWNIWDNDRYIEVWNDVFMEFYKDENWSYTKLAQQNVDTGMWLERITMVLQWKETVFETDLFEWILKTVEKYTNHQYAPYLKKDKEFNDEERQITKRFRVIADHIRSSVFMIWDWIIPSNEWRWYVLRRIIRRMAYNLDLLNKGVNFESFATEIINWIEVKYWKYRKEISINKSSIISTLVKEVEQFRKTIENWIKEFDKIVSEIKKSDTPNRNYLTWTEAFKLYDTYGLPIDVIEEIAFQKWFTEKGLHPVPRKDFEIAMEQAREKSREGTKDMFKRWIDWAKYLEWVNTTQFVWYDKLEESDVKLIKEIDVNWQKVLVFDKTPFYAESGGQTWDKWEITLDDGRKFKVIDVQKYAWVFLHFVE